MLDSDGTYDCQIEESGNVTVESQTNVLRDPRSSGIYARL